MQNNDFVKKLNLLQQTFLCLQRHFCTKRGIIINDMAKVQKNLKKSLFF